MPRFSADHQFAFDWLEPDANAISKDAGRFLDEVLAGDLVHSRVLISCGKHKKRDRAKAADLYTSPRFRMSVGIARQLALPFSILSAKHGLLSPNKTVEPYDLQLSSLSAESRLAWSKAVFKAIISAKPAITRVIVLAHDEYAHDLVPALRQEGTEVIEPMRGFSDNSRMMFLNACLRKLERRSAVQKIYAQFERHEKGTNLFTLQEALRHDLPNQGVYFFFDPNEPTQFSKVVPRLVRVGTHGVSEGSKASLRNRLRTHLGTGEGLGNHRSSVFRLHVGDALIRKNNMRDQFPHWGKGQTTEIEIRRREAELESAVSTYISQLQIVVLEVSDQANKESARSLIERLSIAVFTEDFFPIEEPSLDWLGLFSQHQTIVQTGLWNLRDSGSRADLQIVDLLRERVIADLKKGSVRT